LPSLDTSQDFASLLALLWRAVTISPCFPSLLCFLDRLLSMLATVISSPAIVVAELLSNGILYKLFVAFPASGH
jgi:hypothetical protein